ncbi:MAG: flagellar hook capping FlgD N-terminal domain-containing protein [Chloroflexota bacterium]|nr:MAG: flagellar hook capping protein [Bellilinea sp.]
MQVQEVSQSMFSAVGQTSTPKMGNQPGMGDFLTMLVAQLTHQNPLEPMKDSEMMSQFTQLNSLQELQAMRVVLDSAAAANQNAYAASLIGKIVKVAQKDGSTLEGVVGGVTSEKGVLYLQIGSQKAPLSDVIEIRGGAG